MSEKANALLAKMLQTGQVSSERVRDVTIPASRIRNYPYPSAEDNRTFHAHLGLAETAGAIAIEWRRHYEGLEIERLRLLDAQRLASFLKIPYLPSLLEKIFSPIEVPLSITWLESFLIELRGRWEMGKTLYGLSVDNADRLPDIIAAIEALSTQHLNSLIDYRQFGARYLSHSKRTTEISGVIASLMRKHYDLTGLSDKEVLQQFNLVPMEHPVLIHGPINFAFKTDTVSAEVGPYIGVPYELLEQFTFTKEPRYILTIENQSSFMEYVHTIQDGGVVLYTGGFPTGRLQTLYTSLTSSSDAPCYHWGDTDPHGFLILRTLQRVASCETVVPHLMDQQDGRAYSERDKASLKQMMPINIDTDMLLTKLIARGTGLIEQEVVSAISPRPL